MNTVSVLFIAAILAMAASAPNKNEITKVFNTEKQNRWEWQGIEHLDKNIDYDHMQFIIEAIFAIFPHQPEDDLRMQELVASLDSNPDLASYCPTGNRWSVFGFKLCDIDYVMGSPHSRYFVFRYDIDDVVIGGYALYNDCK